MRWRALSVVVPTYAREEVLIDTVQQLIEQAGGRCEVLVVDQTLRHKGAIEDQLHRWDQDGAMRWIRLPEPSITHAMNVGLGHASHPFVLFLDDDILPSPGLVEEHVRAHREHPDAWAVVGQVLQPEDWDGQLRVDPATAGKSCELRVDGGNDEWRMMNEEGGGNGRGQKSEHRRQRAEDRELRVEPATAGKSCELGVNGRTADQQEDRREREEDRDQETRDHGPGTTHSRLVELTGDLDFDFASDEGRFVRNVMAGNLSVKRDMALEIGGFDENFVGSAYRFETEFAKRILANGGKIWFEPRASIKHLRAERGGTRAEGSHLTSMSPRHGVGDYYYALKCGEGWERAKYVLRRPFREVRTKFHLKHPRWIPVKFIGELRALMKALRLYHHGPRLLPTNNTNRHE